MGKERKPHGKNPPPKRGKPSEELEKPPTREISPKTITMSDYEEHH